MVLNHGKKFSWNTEYQTKLIDKHIIMLCAWLKEVQLKRKHKNRAIAC
jgi:hypothetical protein